MTGIGQVTVNFLQKLTEFSTRLPDGQVSNFQFPNEASNLKLQDIHFVLYCQEKPKLDFQLPANFEIHVFLPWWKRDDVLRQWLWEWQLSREALRDGCEVFFSLYQSATIFPFSSKVRHVMLVHDLIPKLFPGYLHKWSNKLHYRAILQGIKRASHIIAPSHTTKRDLERVLGSESRAVTVVSLGVDPSFFESVDRATLESRLGSYGIKPGYFYHGGGLEIRKNTEAVLRAYAVLVREGISSLPPLVISGKIHAETNPLATPVKRLIEELGLVDRVKLLGAVPQADLSLLYRGASVFLFPSSYEGFGLPVLEAFASGTPVITTTAGALEELTQGETTLTVAIGPKLVDELALRMKAVVQDATQTRSMVQLARTRAEAYTWRSFAEGVVRCLIQ